MVQEKRPLNPQKTPFVFSILASLLVTLFPSFYLYAKNFKYLSYDDILLAVGIVTLHWFILLVVNLLLIKQANKAILATIIAILPLSLFHLGVKAMSKVFPNFYYWHGAILVICVYAILWILLISYLSEKSAKKLNMIIGLVFIGLIAINGYKPLINAFQNRGIQNKEVRTSAAIGDQETLIAKTNDLPNLYLFIFDEYSGNEALERYTGFDNKDFYKNLTNLGFNISHTSRNYTISTSVEIPNLLNLSIQTKEASVTKKDELLANPTLFSMLKELGYDLNLINDQGFISTPKSNFKYVYAAQGRLERDESLTILLIDTSFYYPFRKESSQVRLNEVKEMVNYAGSSSQLQESNLFTLGYFLFPHLPWVVDENGNETFAEDRNNWEKPEVYLGQLKYANKLILQTVEEILKNDPDACIVLMSDHAYRQPFHLKEHYGAVIEDYHLESFYMRNILNAVYFGGDKIDIEGYSGINTLRTVLNKLYGLNLELIEESRKQYESK